jgi:hypothetical protein
MDAIVASELMLKRLFIIVVALVLSPLSVWQASAQTRLTPKSPVSRGDNCAPIGRTANGELVYSMKCENLPPPSPPPQARIEETAPPPSPPPQPETQKGGLFGWSYDHRSDQ